MPDTSLRLFNVFVGLLLTVLGTNGNEVGQWEDPPVSSTSLAWEVDLRFAQVEPRPVTGPCRFGLKPVGFDFRSQAETSEGSPALCPTLGESLGDLGRWR